MKGGTPKERKIVVDNCHTLSAITSLSTSHRLSEANRIRDSPPGHRYDRHIRYRTSNTVEADTLCFVFVAAYYLVGSFASDENCPNSKSQILLFRATRYQTMTWTRWREPVNKLRMPNFLIYGTTWGNTTKLRGNNIIHIFNTEDPR